MYPRSGEHLPGSYLGSTTRVVTSADQCIRALAHGLHLIYPYYNSILEAAVVLRRSAYIHPRLAWCTKSYLVNQYDNTPAGQAGKVQKRLEEFGKVLFPVAGQFTKSAGASTTSSSSRRETLQTTMLPVKSHTEFIGPISWYMKQRVGVHLFRIGMALKFGSLYLRLGFSHSTSCTQGHCFFRNRSMYTTTEQILHRWGQIHRYPVSMRRW